MVKIQNAANFDVLYQKLVLDEPELKEIVFQRVKWFEKNSNDTRLRNHPLKKTLKGRWAFSITDDIRIVYKWLGKKKVRFLAIGTHKTVYKREETN